MKFYIDEKTKQEIEAKIAELEDVKTNCKTDYEWNESVVEQNVYKKVLESATILPVKRHWYGIIDVVITDVLEKYPKGVIIQSQI
jgi:hypothetical protein